MLTKIIAVMAGTPVDTQMGVDFLRSRDPALTFVSCPTAADPRAQTAFQLGPLEARIRRIRQIIRDAKGQGAEALLVYCNSLSGSLDFEALCAQEDIPVVTPLMAHRSLAARSKSVGLLAANNQSLCAIEKIMFEGNPACDVLGVSLLPVVFAIERRDPPRQIVEELGLLHVLRFYEQNRVDQVDLGCTHFPYLAEELGRRTDLSIFNPDDCMYGMLRGL